MSKERLIKEQARQALKGNMTVLVAGFLMLVSAVLVFFYLPYFGAYLFNIVNASTDEIYSGKEIWYLLLSGTSMLIALFFTPLINGYMKLATDSAIRGSCEMTGLFYYFSSPSKYFRTLVVNAGLACVFSVLTVPLVLAGRLLPDSVPEAAVSAALVVWQLLIYLFFIHYPLAAYALDDTRALHYYIFGCIGFSFRYSGALFKLIISMFGWVALCFFVLPALYVVPYMTVTLMNSARWLFAMNHKIQD